MLSQKISRMGADIIADAAGQVPLKYRLRGVPGMLSITLITACDNTDVVTGRTV